jgi:hypothetical protein
MTDILVNHFLVGVYIGRRYLSPRMMNQAVHHLNPRSNQPTDPLACHDRALCPRPRASTCPTDQLAPTDRPHEPRASFGMRTLAVDSTCSPPIAAAPIRRTSSRRRSDPVRLPLPLLHPYVRRMFPPISHASHRCYNKDLGWRLKTIGMDEQTLEMTE